MNEICLSCRKHTKYTFKDFDYTDWETSGGNWNDQAEYRTWLAKRFGVPYLADLLEHKAGVKADLVMKILGEVMCCESGGQTWK